MSPTNRTYSHSSLSCYRNCPRQFKFRYIEKPSIPRKITADTYLGNAIHRVLKELYSLGADGILMSLEQVFEAYQKQWNAIDLKVLTVISSNYGVDDYIRIGKELLEKHYHKYKPFNQGTLLAAERSLSFALPGTSFKFRAIIDRLRKDDDGTVEICDYKTGKNLPLPTDKGFYYQMGLYQLAVQASFPQFEKIELAQYIMRRDEVVRYQMSPEEIDELTEALKQAVLAILDSEQRNDFPAKEGPLCDYCDYFNLCPAKRHKIRLDELDKTDGDDQSDEERAADLASRYLDTDAKIKELQAEQKALRKEIINIVRALDMTILVGKTGEVKVSIVNDEKFVTKTENAALFADLSFAARQMELDEYFSLDARALLKEGIKKGRLNSEQIEKLRKFVVPSESVTLRTKVYKPIADEL